MEYNEFYQKFIDLSRDERMNLCKNATGELLEAFKKRGLLENQDFALSFFTSLIGFFIGADGKVTPNETAIFNEIFGVNYSPNELAGFLPKIMDTDNFIALDDFIDGLTQEEKNFACYIILAVISADGEVSEREARLFERVLA